MLLDLARAWLAEPTVGAARTAAAAAGMHAAQETCQHESASRRVALAVVGAHLRGQPLNGQLTQRGARYLRTAKTAPVYRLYALPPAASGGMAKPGLLRLPQGQDGAAIDVEVWDLPLAAYGDFMTLVPPPLSIGTLTLADGAQVQGFLCESAALQGALDITAFGGWRAYLASGTAATIEEKAQ
jgi:allophanate hydrolase